MEIVHDNHDHTPDIPRWAIALFIVIAIVLIAFMVSIGAI